MVREWRIGQMEQNMRDSMSMEKNMEKEFLILLMDQDMKENSFKMIFMDREHMYGLINESIQVKVDYLLIPFRELEKK